MLCRWQHRKVVLAASCFFFSSRRRHTRFDCDWSSDVCSSDLRESARMTDFLLVAWVSALIEFTRFGWMLGLGKRWTPGEKLKLLFAGYNGTRKDRKSVV